MNNNIHPEYVTQQFICSHCGTKIETRSTCINTLPLETCSRCHPAYTGQHRVSSSSTRLDRFNNQYGGEGKSKGVRSTG